MLKYLPDDIDQYIHSHCSPESAVLQELARETRAKSKDSGMMVGHVQGLFLRSLVRMTRAKRVLEIGTFTGYSALAMAEGLPEDGEVLTCDVDPKNTAIARQYWDRSPHGGKITLRLGPALKTIETVSGLVDLVFIDADKRNYVQYWDAVVPKLRHGGVVVADNVLWSGRVLDPQSNDDHAIVAFNDHVLKDQRVEVVMLPLRDGVLLATRL
jgi:caffeoyl-CoA O-methyltransferase